MATIPSHVMQSDCRMYITGTHKSCDLSGNGQIVFTDSNNSGVGVIVLKRQVFKLYLTLDFSG